MDSLNRINNLEQEKTALVRDILDHHQTLNHYEIMMEILENEINRLGENSARAQPIIEALEFFGNWYDEIKEDTRRMTQRLRNIINEIDMDYLN